MELPKKLFIYVENEGDEKEEFLSTKEELSEIVVETGKRQLVGVYELKQKIEVVTETTMVTEVG